MESLFTPMTETEARLLSPLQLAFVGDSVHAMLVRSALIRGDWPVAEMHRYANQAVNASSQARASRVILPLLKQEEADVMRRGRNAHPHHGAPRSASPMEYAAATGLEALLGYLYLTGQTDRIMALAPYLIAQEEWKDA